VMEEPLIGLLESTGARKLRSIADAASPLDCSVGERPITCWSAERKSRRDGKWETRVFLFNR